MGADTAKVTAIDDLRVGMYIHLELSWMSHPFPRSSFRIEDAGQIERIRALGLKSVRWDPLRSHVTSSHSPPVGAAGAGSAGSAAADADATPQSGSPGQAAVDDAPARARREALVAQRQAARLCEVQYAEASLGWHQTMERVHAAPKAAGRDAQALTQALLDKMLNEDELCIRVLNVGNGDRGCAHAMNVAVLSLLLGRLLRLDAATLNELGTGALLHDVGKLDLPERLQHADPYHTAAERAVYASHVAQGEQQARRMGLSSIATSIVSQHHERHDGTGFPRQIGGDAISLGARIVGLVNRYDKLCNPPLLARALSPHEALSLLFGRYRGQHDNVVMQGFIRLMGVYPAGSVVQLTDERYALVISVNAKRPLKPQVLVFDPATPRDQALFVDLGAAAGLGIRRSLRPTDLPGDALDYLAPRSRTTYFFEPGAAQGVLLDAQED
jgi:putative nucleotidyltransferase with HDIG domain